MPVITRLTNQGDVILFDSQLIHDGVPIRKAGVPAVYGSATASPIALTIGIGTILASSFHS